MLIRAGYNLEALNKRPMDPRPSIEPSRKRLRTTDQPSPTDGPGKSAKAKEKSQKNFLQAAFYAAEAELGLRQPLPPSERQFTPAQVTAFNRAVAAAKRELQVRLTPGHQNHLDRLSHVEDAERLGVIVESVVENNDQPDDPMDCEQSQPIVSQETLTEINGSQPAGSYPAGILGSILAEMSQNGPGAPARKSFADATKTPPAKPPQSGKKTRSTAKQTALPGKTNRSEGKVKP